MYQDPYKVLGVSPDSSDDEIKKAYRDLAKRYHPDRNPGDAQAAEKMNEINAAYDAIKNGNARPQYSNPYGSPFGSQYGPGSSYGYSGNYGSYGYSDYYGSRSYYGNGGETERNEFSAARSYIRNGMYEEAMTALSGVPESERNGKWYYMFAVANMYKGNKVAALEAAKMACSMDPGNEEYQALLSRLEHGGNFYDGYTAQVSAPLCTNNLCMTLCALNMCMGPMCGWRIICC